MTPIFCFLMISLNLPTSEAGTNCESPLSGIHVCSTAVIRGAIPSTLAPGFNRPIARSQFGIVSFSNELDPRSIGSCCNGSQNAGGEELTVSPKKPGGAIPTTVNGCPSMLKVAPTTDGSLPYSCCHT